VHTSGNYRTMKHTNKLFALATILTLVFSVGCKKDDPNPPSQDVPGQALAGTWTVTEANNVTGPAADQFSNFSITITANASGVNYTTTNSGDELVFPDAGSFVVEASDDFDEGAEVLREPDNVPVDINLLEGGDVMNMTFTIDISTASINGRVAGINGEYNFTLNKGSSN